MEISNEKRKEKVHAIHLFSIQERKGLMQSSQRRFWKTKTTLKRDILMKSWRKVKRKTKEPTRYIWSQLQLIIIKDMTYIWQAHFEVSEKTLENLEFIEIGGWTHRWEREVDRSLKKRNRSLDCRCSQWVPRIELCVEVQIGKAIVIE